MYTTDSTQAWFARYSAAARKLEILQKRLAVAEAKAQKPERLEILRQDIAKAREAASNVYSEIDGVIQHLDDKERTLIDARYLGEEKWRDINNLLFGEKPNFGQREKSYLRTTFFLHTRAIQKITDILNDQADKTEE